ncbi:MAG: exodeoxyribonuclease III [Archaeoglobaceae archaeon]
MAVKIATYNANSIRSRTHIVIPWLKKHQPDILCMQETKVEDKKFPESEFHRIGYKVTFSGAKGRNGVAIASLQEPESVEFGLDTEPQDKDRVIKAEFPYFTVINTYVPQGYKIDSPKYQYKLEWLDRLKDYLQKTISGNQQVVWLGDLNVAPEEIDVDNPKNKRRHVCFHEDVRNAFKEVKSVGFEDVFRKHHPEPGQYTFFDYRVKDGVNRGKGWRVDHIMATPPMAERSRDCYIDLQTRLEEKPSDHAIVAAEFQVE